LLRGEYCRQDAQEGGAYQPEKNIFLTGLPHRDCA
jgi:hypothetical protein